MNMILDKAKKTINLTLINSLKQSAREHKFDGFIAKLEAIVPDLSDQYTSLKVNNTYLKTKVRNMHAFQISMVDMIIDEFKNPVIVDIGDSSGTHLQYIKGLYSEDKDIRTLSVNLDIRALEKIKKKNLAVLQAKAEDLGEHGIDADIFLCFEVLEHLTDPCRFLYGLSTKTSATYIVFTVPYLQKSRVGLHHLRRDDADCVSAEKTHIFELCPGDWKLIARHSGWEIVHEKIYMQYPKSVFSCFTKYLWRKYDFEGFYGFILKKNNFWSSRYLDW